MATVTGMKCCGLGEINQLTGYRGKFNYTLQNILKVIDYYGFNDDTLKLKRGAYVFTSAGAQSKYAQRFADDLTTKKLGEVISLPHFINPNTSRHIRAYVWIPNRAAVKQYIISNRLGTPGW